MRRDTSRRELRVNADDDRFLDFYYPWDNGRPSGVYETGIGEDVVSEIESIAAVWPEPDPRADRWPFVKDICDCKIAVRWSELLRGRQIDCCYEGVMTDDPDEEPPTGYRVKSGLVVVHYWVVIGDERRVFDPTASQFHTGGICQLGRRLDRGGISLDRYIVDGERLVDVRSRIHSDSADSRCLDHSSGSGSEVSNRSA